MVGEIPQYRNGASLVLLWGCAFRGVYLNVYLLACPVKVTVGESGLSHFRVCQVFRSRISFLCLLILLMALDRKTTQLNQKR